jgi:hypothetical protein
MDIPITLDICIKLCTNIGVVEFDQYTILCISGQLIPAIQYINMFSTKGFSVMDILDGYFEYIKYTCTLNDLCKYKITKLIMKYITIFHNIHEDDMELVLFTNELIKVINL